MPISARADGRAYGAHSSSHPLPFSTKFKLSKTNIVVFALNCNCVVAQRRHNQCRAQVVQHLSFIIIIVMQPPSRTVIERKKEQEVVPKRQKDADALVLCIYGKLEDTLSCQLAFFQASAVGFYFHAFDFFFNLGKAISISKFECTS